MPFFGFQKKPLFNRGFRREILKVAIFDPPQETPEIPNFGHFWPFWATFWPQKRPFLTPFRPPQNRPPPKILENGPFGENRGFQARFEPQKGGGGWGFTQGPPKKAIFGHFWPFLAILAILAIFGKSFLDPQNVSESGEFWPKKGEKPPPKPPWPDRLYLIIGLLGRKFGICAENEDFSAPPTGAGNVSESGRNYPVITCEYFNNSYKNRKF